MKKQKISHDRTEIFFVLLLCVVVLFLISVQTAFLSPLRLFGGVPDLMLAFTVSVGLFRGKKYGGAFGIFAGVLSYAVGGGGVTILPLFYMLCGYFAPVCQALLPANSFLSRAAICAGSCIADMFALLIGAVLRLGEFSLSVFFVREMLPALCLTALFFPAVFFLLLPICRIGLKRQ